MTENERLTEATKDCFGYGLKDFTHKKGEFKDYDTFYAYQMAIKRLGEYEDIGTVEDILMGIRKSEEEFDMLMEYRAIGTIEEFKALKEKAEPKKSIILDEQYSGGEVIEVEWKCPVCGLNVIEEPPCREYCQRCGNKLKWKY